MSEQRIVGYRLKLRQMMAMRNLWKTFDSVMARRNTVPFRKLNGY